MDNFRDSYFNVAWDLTNKHLRGTFWGKQYDTGRGFAVTVINGGQVVSPTTEVLRLKWEKPDNTSGYVQATIINGKFVIENIDQMFTVAGSVRADLELSVGGNFVASITFYVSVEKAVAVDAIESSSQFTALQNAVATVDNIKSQLAEKVSKGQVAVSDINKNLGKFDQTYLSDTLLQQMAGNTPINAVPANDSLTTEKYANGSVLFNKQNFVRYIQSEESLFNGIYYRRWVDSATGAYSQLSYTSLALIQVKPNTTYKIKTTGVHNRMVVSFLNDPNAFGSTANVRIANVVTGNVNLSVINTDYKYMAIGVSVTNQEPELVVTSLNERLFIDKTKSEEVSSYYKKAWVNYTTGAFSTSVAVDRSVIYEVEFNTKITIQTKGTHDRFVIATSNSIEQGNVTNVVYTGANGDGTSTGNEKYTFTNGDYKYLIIGLSTDGVKPLVYVTQHKENYKEIALVGRTDSDNSNGSVSVRANTGIEKTKEVFPVMFGVKMSNERDLSYGNAECPRPVGWLYYHPQTYQLIYANGSPENMKYLCDWNFDVTWDGISTPEQYRPFITKDGDIIFVWRGDSLGYDTGIPNVRQNPIIYPANDWDNPIEVQLTGEKPTAWLQNCGADYIYNQVLFDNR